MLDLHDREWKEFLVGTIFSVKRPKARSEKQYEYGKAPFVASGNVNNGVIKCCTPNENEKLDAGNCITVSPVDGSAFYQGYDFLGRGGAGSSILMLYNPNMNKYSGLFISRMIRQTCSKYSYGKMGSQESIKRERIMLPVDESGNPDYAFMEQYIKEREQQIVQNYINYIGNNIQMGGGITPLDQKDWKEFYLYDIFADIRRGKRLKTADHIQGNIPYVSSSAVNNGVDALIGNTGKIRKFADCITLANSGSVGKTFYHKYEFIASDHVTALKSDKLNEYSYLFVATIMQRLENKYSFNREINDMRINKEKIVLPVDESGNPDYTFMEQYVKQVQETIKLQYLQEKVTVAI